MGYTSVGRGGAPIDTLRRFVVLMRSLIALSTGVVLVLELVELFLVACLWVLAL